MFNSLIPRTTDLILFMNCVKSPQFCFLHVTIVIHKNWLQSKKEMERNVPLETRYSNTAITDITAVLLPNLLISLSL